jgi:hypothetical protein
MTVERKEEIGEILDAIRQVEHRLDRRSDRVGGAILLMWGVITVLIAAFYQLVTWNPGLYHAALGPLLGWMWVGPVAVGYAVSVLVGVRSGSAQTRRASREWMLDTIPSLVTSMIAVVLVLIDRSAQIAGALLVGFSLSLALRCRRSTGTFRTVAWVAVLLNAIVGVALLARPVDWQWLVMGLVFGGSLFALGRVRMMRG